MQIALSAIDMALWDTLARAAGVPLCRLLGAEPRPLPIYASLRGWGAAMLAEEAGQAVATLGAGVVKFKLGQPRLEDDLDTVRAVRAAVGDGVGILVDYNQGLTRPEAERRGLALQDLDVRWLEEPLPVDDEPGLAALRAALRLPIQGGENSWGPKGMARALEAGAVDLCMPDAMKIGGVTGWQQAAALAAAKRIPMSSHIFIEASAQLLPATPTAHLLEHLDVAGPLLQAPLQVKGRHGPGAGPARPRPGMGQGGTGPLGGGCLPAGPGVVPPHGETTLAYVSGASSTPDRGHFGGQCPTRGGPASPPRRRAPGRQPPGSRAQRVHLRRQPDAEPLNSSMGRVVPAGPETKLATTTSSSERVKASSQPAISAGAISGR